MTFAAKTVRYRELDDKTEIWFGRVSDISAHAGAICEWLSDGERERLGAFSLDRERKSFVATRILLKCVLSRFVDVPARSWQIDSDPFGAPYIRDKQNPFGIQINLSKSIEWVACAVSRVRCGVDVEDVTRPVDLESEPANILSGAELEQLDALPREEKTSYFFKLWCLKEAYVKARGVGFHQKATSFSVQLLNEDGPCVTTSNSRLAGASDQKEQYRFALFKPDAKHLLAAAHQLSEKSPTGFEIRDFSVLPTLR